MDSGNTTIADLKREAIKQYNQKSPLYWDIVTEFSAIDSSLLVEIVQRELMRRIAYTNSKFEHLSEAVDVL